MYSPIDFNNSAVLVKSEWLDRRSRFASLSFRAVSPLFVFNDGRASLLQQSYGREPAIRPSHPHTHAREAKGASFEPKRKFQNEKLSLETRNALYLLTTENRERRKKENMCRLVTSTKRFHFYLRPVHGMALIVCDASSAGFLCVKKKNRKCDFSATVIITREEQEGDSHVRESNP